MNHQVSCLIAKYAKLKDYNYKVCKRIYDNANPERKRKYLLEMGYMVNHNENSLQ